MPLPRALQLGGQTRGARARSPAVLCRSTRLVLYTDSVICDHRLCIVLTTAGARRPHARQSGCRGVAQSSCVTLPPPRADEPAWVACEACVAAERGERQAACGSSRS